MTINEKPENVEILRKIANLDAPDSYVNYRLFREGAPRQTTVEAPIYTDTWLLGEYESGPLKFINTLANRQQPDDFRPGIILRFVCCWPQRLYSGLKKAEDKHYHGGDYIDEIAALISLILGVRAQAGPITREFSCGGDPLGRPIMLGGKAIPRLGAEVRNPMVPKLRKQANLTDLRLISVIPALSALEATAVFKAARTYQSALWVADSSPEMAWLFLVSAIETAASHWSTEDENFKDLDAELTSDVRKLLDEHDCPNSVYQPLAQLLRTKTKSTQKFLQFLDAFLPAPPPDDERAKHESQRIAYDRGALKRDFNWIYGRRSKALHDGVPFPYSVCVPPTEHISEERVLALGASALGATWDFRKHAPLMFHTFEHIVRGALQNWLKSLGNKI